MVQTCAGGIMDILDKNVEDRAARHEEKGKTTEKNINGYSEGGQAEDCVTEEGARDRVICSDDP